MISQCSKYLYFHSFFPKYRYNEIKINVISTRPNEKIVKKKGKRRELLRIVNMQKTPASI
jgi:hypothetical protein